MPILQFLFWAIPIIATGCYLLLLVVFLISKRDKVMHYYTIILSAFAIWSGSSLLMRLQVTPGVLFWSRLSLCGLFLSPLCIYYLTNYFIACRTPKADMFWNAATSFVIILNVIGFVVSEATITKTLNANNDFVVSFNYALGPLSALACAITTALVLFIFYKAFCFRKQNNQRFVQVKPILATLAIMFIGAICNLVPALGQYPIDIFCCIVGAFILCCNIFKNRLFEIYLLISRGILFCGFSLLIITLYVLIILTMQRQLSLLGETAYLGLSFVALIAAAVFQPLLILSRKLIDRWFYRSSFTQRNALRTFNINSLDNLSTGELVTQLLKVVDQGICSTSSCLLLQNSETGSYCVFAASMHLTTTDLVIGEHSPVIHWLNQNKDCLNVSAFEYDPQFNALWEEERKAFEHWDVQVVVPARCHGILIGIILLTTKRDGTAYTVEDLSLLRDFGITAANAIERSHLYRQPQPQSFTDDLTGLYNTRYLYQYLPTVITPENDSPVSVIIFDVDLFRVYNDLYGHLEGDKALRRIAALIRTTVGECGICARYGGEEFAVVLPDFSNEQAFLLAEKVRLKVQQLFFGTEPNDRRFLTISVGVCTYPTAAPNQDELMMRADLALYTAKNSGKNKTVIYSPNLTYKTKLNSDEYNGLPSDSFVAALNLDGMQNSPAYAATLYALTAAIDTKDHFTFSHSQNVARYASALAAKLGMAPVHVSIIYEAGLLHDIGKIGIPEHILAKPDLLTAEEYAIMQQHVEMSITIVKHLPSLNYVIPAIMGHHERWDGKGYPRGLVGEQIPISARCLAIADSFDAIISKRPYKESLPIEFALKELEHCAGTHFDPEIMATFVSMVRSGEIALSESEGLPPIAVPFGVG